MYNKFFGFKERPFQLVPNPAYLFLSRSHEEALAHLTYAVSQGDGFVEITGEVGTGKTTLCRAFLENLDEKTDVAYIFNPKLNSVQLLRAINDEFSIPSNADAKDLIDAFNRFLMAKKAEGRKVVLLIDEAQNLNFEVLEQLRLLSNLETSTSKLLQIILVGQPELGEMLDSYELRQLSQRITLSCHLRPLSLKETKDYIRHRIRVASTKPSVHFTQAAFKAIHQYSSGIPRLINIACDRAILTAYGLNEYKITGDIAKSSIRELAGRGERKRFSFQEDKKSVLVFSVLCIILASLVLYPPLQWIKDAPIQTLEISAPQRAKRETPKHEPQAQIPKPVKAKEKKEESPAPAAIKPVTYEKPEIKPEPVTADIWYLDDLLRIMDMPASRHAAIQTALEMWNPEAKVRESLDSINDEQTFFRLAAKQNSLLIQRIERDIDLILRLNLPVVLEFHSPIDLSMGYMTLIRVKDGIATLKAGDSVAESQLDSLDLYWSGVAYIPWMNFFSYTGNIPRGSSEDMIIALKMHLQDIGFNDIELGPVYDDRTRRAIEEIQEKHGLKADGVVGPLTKIILYNELKSLKIPHIMDERR